MPTLVDQTIGPRSVPQEVRDLRKSSLEFHHELGEPVIVKHKWNEQDLREGRAQPCPYHDNLYDRDSDWDPYCFGTGYLGGWENGKIVYVSLSDAQEDVFRQNEQGVLIHESHPGMTAPWMPEMGDGDLIIRAEFDPETWEILDTYERYEIQEVTPTTMRGPGYDNTVKNKRFLVNQTATIDKLPYNHPWYNVPIDFDYGNVPPVPVDPNVDPDVYPPGTQFSAAEVAFRIIGKEGLLKAEREVDFRVAVAGTISETDVDFRLVGKAGGSHVFVD